MPGMSAPGRPKGEFLNAKHEGTPVSAPGRHRPQADGLRQATDNPQGLSVSSLSSQALNPERAARRVFQ